VTTGNVLSLLTLARRHDDTGSYFWRLLRLTYWLTDTTDVLLGTTGGVTHPRNTRHYHGWLFGTYDWVLWGLRRFLLRAHSTHGVIHASVLRSRTQHSNHVHSGAKGRHIHRGLHSMLFAQGSASQGQLTRPPGQGLVTQIIWVCRSAQVHTQGQFVPTNSPGTTRHRQTPTQATRGAGQFNQQRAKANCGSRAISNRAFSFGQKPRISKTQAPGI